MGMFGDDVGESPNQRRVVPGAGGRPALTKGIPAMPVYAWWLRVNISKHEICCPSMGGVPKQGWRHIELSSARGPVGIFQKFTSKKTRSDGQKLALFGHDSGPFVPHICNPPDNTLLAVTMMKSKCKWPVSAGRVKVEGKIPCAFQQLIVPYIHCHERGQDNDKKKQPKPTPPAADAQSKKLEFKPAEEKVSVSAQMPGFGFVMIPTGPQTVEWRLGFRDVVLGVFNIMVDVGFDYCWKRFHNAHGARGLQKAVARRLGKSEAQRAVIDKVLDKTIKDYVKGFASSAELRAPLKLAKLDLKTGKVTIWKWEACDVGWKLSDSVPFNYPGWDPLLVPRNQVLDELLGGVPHAD